MRVTIKYGTGNELSKEFPEGTTLGCVLGNQHVRGSLGYGASVQGHIGGVPQSDSIVPPDGVTISVQDKSCTKATEVLNHAGPWATPLFGLAPAHLELMRRSGQLR